MMKTFSRNLATAALVRPSRILPRLDEFYDAVLAEDLAILAYSHANVSPTSPHLRSLALMSAEMSKQHADKVKWKIEREILDREAARVKAGVRNSSAAKQLYAASSAVMDKNSAYKRFLAPIASSLNATDDRQFVYEQLPQLLQVNVRMTMVHGECHYRIRLTVSRHAFTQGAAVRIVGITADHRPTSPNIQSHHFGCSIEGARGNAHRRTSPTEKH